MSETADIYDPGLFDQPTLEAAKFMVLSPQDGYSVSSRWNVETPYLADLIQQHLAPTMDSVLVDYGCGVGRLAKPLIDTTQCRVIGVDISPNMRAFAAHYVSSPRFIACGFDFLPLIGKDSCDGAIAVWSLQHCFEPMVDISRIRWLLRPKAKLIVLNDARYVPVRGKRFVSDKIDMNVELQDAFGFSESVSLDPDKFAPFVRERIKQGIVTCKVYTK